MSAEQTPATEIGYNQAIAELDRILAELDGDSVDVDRLGSQVRRASELITLCRGRINSARIEIEAVAADLDRLSDAT